MYIRRCLQVSAAHFACVRFSSVVYLLQSVSITHLLPTRPGVAHRKATKSRQSCLSLRSLLMVLQLCLSTLNSLSTVLRHIGFGRPLLPLPSGFHGIAILATLWLSFRKTCSVHLHLVRITSSIIHIESVRCLPLILRFF